MKGEIKEIPLSKIRECPWNPRKEWDLDPLAEDMSKRGQLQNILVRPAYGGYEVVFGERRVMAARARKLKNVWARVMELPDDEAMIMTYQENEVRKGLSGEEREELIYKMWESGHWGSKVALANELGISDGHLSNLLRDYEDRKDLNMKTSETARLTSYDLTQTRGLDKPTRKALLTKVAKGEIPSTPRSPRSVDKVARILKKAPEPIKKAILKDEVDFEDVKDAVEYGIPEDMVKETLEEMKFDKQEKEEVKKKYIDIYEGRKKSTGITIEREDITSSERMYDRIDGIYRKVKSLNQYDIKVMKIEEWRFKAIERLVAIRDLVDDLLIEVGR